jgi:hypothetical protein
MFALLWFVLAVLASPFKSKSRLEAENAALGHQLIVLRRKVRGRAKLTNNDRWFLIQLYRWFPSILQVVTIIRPETLLRRRRAVERRQVHDQATRAARLGMGHLPAEPRAGHCCRCRAGRDVGRMAGR